MLGKSGTMENEMIYQMFCRSLSKCRVRYVLYIRDGKAKVHKYLTSRPPYIDLTIKKLEDTNHLPKRMLSPIKEMGQANKHKILPDGKAFRGKDI